MLHQVYFNVFSFFFRKYLHADNVKALLGIKPCKKVEFNMAVSYHLAVQHIPYCINSIHLFAVEPGVIWKWKIVPNKQIQVNKLL